jgi:hypothetical protein
MTSTPDTADPTLCDKRCMYDSYVSVNTDSGVSHFVVASTYDRTYNEYDPDTWHDPAHWSISHRTHAAYV